MQGAEVHPGIGTPFSERLIILAATEKIRPINPLPTPRKGRQIPGQPSCLSVCHWSARNCPGPHSDQESQRN
jgi:hypothetical protein